MIISKSILTTDHFSRRRGSRQLTRYRSVSESSSNSREKLDKFEISEKSREEET